jgi:trans-aconitate 2-methyltransferase
VQYLKFAEPRLRPALDLLARVPLTNPVRVNDLGCGTGDVTRLLQARWPGAAITGVDYSERMLQQARRREPTIQWVQASIADWQPEAPAELIYSNAALHWLPEHATLLPMLVGHLAPAGVLAIQMPRNFAAPSHTLIAETVRDGSWREQLLPLLRGAPVHEPAYYLRLLTPLAAEIDIWETEYLHVLRGPDPVKEWVKGSWLKQFLGRLEPADRVRFEADYAARLRTAYPRQADGSTLLPFRRLFILLIKHAAGARGTALN